LIKKSNAPGRLGCQLDIKIDQQGKEPAKDQSQDNLKGEAGSKNLSEANFLKPEPVSVERNCLAKKYNKKKDGEIK
jgi:hypothetical protein